MLLYGIPLLSGFNGSLYQSELWVLEEKLEIHLLHV